MSEIDKMPKNPIRHLSIMLYIGFVLLVSAGGIYAGTTGKIKGRVIDAQTGESLPGVNVQVVGTTLGAATDLDGFYIILNVIPGQYKLKSSYIGYTSSTVLVQITVDLTTTQDFRLTQGAIEANEVTVVAERPIVEMDRTNSASAMSAKQINELPVQTLKDLVQLQAGVVIDSRGGIHIRGGRTSEVAYLVDGVPVTNQFSSDGGSLVGVESGNIQQLQVISGTFNAEYGQAQSGVINIITKDPEKHYSGSVTVYNGDKVSNNSEVFSGVNDFRPSNERNIEGNITGPVPGMSNLGFYFFGRYNKDNGFLFGKRLARPEDAWKIDVYQTWFRRRFPNDPAVQNDIIAIPDSLLTGDGAFVPMSPTKRLFLNFKLIYRISPLLRVSYNVFFENEDAKIYDDNFRFTPDALKKSQKRSQIHLVNINHTLSASTFYNVNFNYTTHREKSFLFGDIVDPRLQTVSPTRDRFRLGGTKPGFDRLESEKLLAKAELTSQLDNHNLLKVGAEFIRHRVFFRSLTPEFSNDAQSNFFARDATLSFAEFLAQSRPAVFVPPQRTILGETGFSDLQYEHHPTELAVYAQNTVELNDLILNMGLRFDSFRPDHQALVNPRVNPIAGSVSLISASTLRKAKTRSQLSPRLGIAFPISDAGVFHVAYGHFFKTPAFEFLFNDSEYKVRGVDGPIVGNPDLKPQKTIAYEIGVQQQLFENVGVDVTLFYSDFRNLVGMEVIRQVGNSNSYLRRTNTANGTNRGFTIALKKRSGGGLVSGSLDYTFQLGKGTESDPNNLAIVQTASAAGGVVEDAIREVVPLDWDQKHTLNATLTVGNSKSWSASLIGRFASGQPFTPEFVRLDIKTKFKNSQNKPFRDNIDLFLKKDFRMGAKSVSFFLRIFNLFDRANELTVFPTTGKATRDQRFPVEAKLDRNRLVGLFTLHDVDIHQDRFSQPRRVQLGFTMSFGSGVR